MIAYLLIIMLISAGVIFLRVVNSDIVWPIIALDLPPVYVPTGILVISTFVLAPIFDPI